MNEAAGDADGGTGFDKRVDKEMERIYKKNNVELAPDFIDNAFKEMIEMAKKGVEKFKEVEKYIKDIEREKEKALLKQEEDRYTIPIQEKIELRHLKATSGFVYVLANELMPNTYKVGFTSRNPDVRAGEISSKSGLPKPFLVVKYWRTDDPYILEQRIHNDLMKFAEGREYFSGPLKEICAAVENLINGHNKIE